MKSIFFLIALFVGQVTRAQLNKPVEGDLGMRYGVAFNGAFAQTLALSGMLPNHWEFGAGVSVSYINSQNQNISPNGSIINSSPILETTTALTRTISVAFLPYAVYHFPIKSNLDVYAGINLIAGTGAITLKRSNSYESTGDGYYSLQLTKYVYPVGYQAGGGLTVGGQYFFYKNLAFGVEATLDGSYTAQKGIYTSSVQNVNNGINNSNTNNTTTAVSGNLDSHSFSFKSASSAGIYLTFYLPAVKDKVPSQK